MGNEKDAKYKNRNLFLQYEYGIQPLETMIFSVKRMNDLGLLKNFTLGLWALDYCSNPYIARLQSLKFFAGATRRTFYYFHIQ